MYAALKQFVQSLIVFIKLSRAGFFFSSNTHSDTSAQEWGFFRFNYVRENVKSYAIFDIDFSTKLPNYADMHDSKKEFWVVHSGNGLSNCMFRVDYWYGGRTEYIDDFHQEPQRWSYCNYCGKTVSHTEENCPNK